MCRNSSCYTFKIHLTVGKFHFNKKLKANNKNPCIKISGLNTLNVFKNYQTGFFEIQIKCCLKDTLTKTHEKTKKGCTEKHEKKIFHANTNSNKTSIYKLISDKVEERKERSIARHKKRYSFTFLHKEEKTTLNLYAPNNIYLQNI